MQPIIIKMLRLNNRHNNDFYCLLIVLEQNWHLIIKCQAKDSEKGRPTSGVYYQVLRYEYSKKNEIHNYLLDL